MKGLCESGCGGTVKVYGCKWCPDCYPNFSAGQSLKERAFIVVAGKYEMDMEEGLTENCKFSSDVLTLDEAEKTLHEYRSYPFARIEYVGDQVGVIYIDQNKLKEANKILERNGIISKGFNT